MVDKERRILWADENSFSVDPSTDGSGYSSVPSMVIGENNDETEILDTDYNTGRAYPTAPIGGAEGGNFPFEMPFYGLATAAGDGTSPPAIDVLDRILRNPLGTVATRDGETVSTHSGTALTLPTDAADAQDVVPIFESGLPSSSNVRTHWSRITADNGGGSYTIPDPGFNFTSAAIAYGTRMHRWVSGTDGPSASIVHIHDGDEYTFHGCRIDQLSLVAELKKIVRLVGRVRYDRSTSTSKGSLPAALAGPPITPITHMLSPVLLNDTAVEVSKVEIDFGLQVEERPASAGNHGRSEIQVLGIEPTITIDPLYQDAYLSLKKNQTVRNIVIQLGGGVFGSSVLNTCCVYAEQATVMDGNATSQNDRKRQTLELKVSDAVTVGSAAARFLQLFRA